MLEGFTNGIKKLGRVATLAGALTVGAPIVEKAVSAVSGVEISHTAEAHPYHREKLINFFQSNDPTRITDQINNENFVASLEIFLYELGYIIRDRVDSIQKTTAWADIKPFFVEINEGEFREIVSKSSLMISINSGSVASDIGYQIAPKNFQIVTPMRGVGSKLIIYVRPNHDTGHWIVDIYTSLDNNGGDQNGEALITPDNPLKAQLRMNNYVISPYKGVRK